MDCSVREKAKKLAKWSAAFAGVFCTGVGIITPEIVELIIFRGTTFTSADALGFALGAGFMAASAPIGFKLKKLVQDFSSGKCGKDDVCLKHGK